MTQFSETLLAILASFGAVCLIWLLFGRLLAPVSRGAGVLLLPISGDGETLEEDLRGALWLRAGGFARFRILLVDCRLTPAGLAQAREMAAMYPAVILCKPQEIPYLILHKEGHT